MKTRLIAALVVAALLASVTGFTGLSGGSGEYHVAKTGNDTNPGTKALPFLTISRAAELAQPGDTITVHAGIYREEIAPPRGGLSDDQRIVYQAAPGEIVSVRGSEVVTGWTDMGNDVWTIEISNSLFGDFNPFADKVSGDWFTDKGRDHHTSSVYLDGEWLFEAASREEVPEAKWPMAYFAEVVEEKTTVWATFDGKDPNQGLTEVNVRQTVFYPRKPFQNYITVRGLDLRHAAPKWAPPTAEQMGLIGTHWSKGWIIEDNTIYYSMNACLSLGKYGDEHDNTREEYRAYQSKEAEGGNIVPSYYLASIERARDDMQWNRETIGSHIVRNNEIAHCEQVGIVGSMGSSFSKVTGNHVHHIFRQGRFSGAEMAGIKFHAPIDVLLENNRVHDTNMAFWLDWMTQGTRVTRNLSYNNNTDIKLEVNHGPCVVDHNLFLSNQFRNMSDGTAIAHNLFACEFNMALDTHRYTPYFPPHSTTEAGVATIGVADTAFHNNLYIGNGTKGPTEKSAQETKARRAKNRGASAIGYGTWVFDEMPTPLVASGNAYYHGAQPYEKEVDSVVSSENPKLRIIEEGSAVYLEITIPDGLPNTRLVDTAMLGKALVTDLPYLDYDGSPIRLDTDYSGNQRSLENPTAGPFENLKPGKQRIRVW